MEAIKYFLWLDPNAAVWFSRHVLMVEGPTEYVLLRQIEGRIEPPTGGVFILDRMANTFHRFMHILGRSMCRTRSCSMVMLPNHRMIASTG